MTQNGKDRSLPDHTFVPSSTVQPIAHRINRPGQDVHHDVVAVDGPQLGAGPLAAQICWRDMQPHRLRVTERMVEHQSLNDPVGWATPVGDGQESVANRNTVINIRSGIKTAATNDFFRLVLGNHQRLA